MTIPGNLLTTAMAVMPHTDAEAALDAALSLDIPFWPQLPRLNYYEDMYVQASEHFPGIVLDMGKQTLSFSMDKFVAELEDTLAHFDEPAYFDISTQYSDVYHRFLKLDFSDRPAIRGQLEGPISFGLNVLDQDKRPIIFDDTVRPFMYEFMAKRINVQLECLKKLNDNAFMFIDEPGLQFLFSALSGYDSNAARQDMEEFFSMLERPCGVHLCGNPDWDFLLNLDMGILSMDVYLNAEIFATYAKSIKRFVDRGGVIAWGIVPTAEPDDIAKETCDSLVDRWERQAALLCGENWDIQALLKQTIITPSCGTGSLSQELALKVLQLTKEVSAVLRAKYLNLS